MMPQELKYEGRQQRLRQWNINQNVNERIRYSNAFQDGAGLSSLSNFPVKFTFPQI